MTSQVRSMTTPCDVIADRRARYLHYRSDPVKVEEQRARTKRWAVANKQRKTSVKVAWQREKRRADPRYALENRLRARIKMALRTGAKASSTESLLGCTIAQLQRHLEAQFKPGMTWELVLSGAIHVDHKIPCAEFDLTDPAQQHRCFHHTNLQPLWKIDNLRKGSKHEPTL